MCRKLYQQIMGVTLIMAFLVGCGGPTATPVAEAPAATPTPKPQTATPMPEPPTATPIPTITPMPTNTPTRTPTPQPTYTPQPVFHWKTDFENGYRDFFVTGDGTHGSLRFGEFSYAEIVPDPTGSGRGMVYRGVVKDPPWPTPVVHMSGVDGNQRAYPGINFPFKAGPFATEFDVFIEQDILPIPYSTAESWISLGSLFGKSEQNAFTIPVLVTLSKSGSIYFLKATTQDIKGNQVKDSTPTMQQFPLNNWVRVRAEVGSDRILRIYQDGQLVSSLRISQESLLGTTGGHWGLYAGGAIKQMILLNDNITIDVYPTMPSQ